MRGVMKVFGRSAAGKDCLGPNVIRTGIPLCPSTRTAERSPIAFTLSRIGCDVHFTVLSMHEALHHIADTRPSGLQDPGAFSGLDGV
jgi:hypothetical protein